jgi:hypothetical protein
VLALLLACCGERDEAPHPFALACARLSACLPLELVDGLGVRRRGYDACRSMTFDQRVQQSWVTIERCVGAAGDCTSVRACLGATGASCEDDGFCDGDVAHVCFAGNDTVRDCALEGFDCAGSGRCLRVGGCEPRCEADRAILCSPQPIIPGYEYATQCEPAQCYVGELGAGCHASREACAFPPEESFCEGDTATSCVSGRVQRRQCASGTCRLATSGRATCSSVECVSSCDGTTLIGCVNDGPRQQVDCVEIGAERCLSLENGARCTGGALAM